MDINQIAADLAALPDRTTESQPCPRCSSQNTRKAGFLQSGHQKYRCDDCGKQWSDSPVGRGRPRLKTDPEASPVPRIVEYALFDRSLLPVAGLSQAAFVKVVTANGRSQAIEQNPGYHIVRVKALRENERSWIPKDS